MSTLIPVANQGLLYVNNLQVAWASTTTLTVAAGQARDSTNTLDIILDSSKTINAAVNGANGLDTGALANSTWYAVYVIGSSNNFAQPATLLSASSSAPTLPTNYDSFRRIGWMLTDGAAALLKVFISGNGNVRKYFWDEVVTELNAGNQTSFTDVDLASSVAPTSNLAYLNWKIVPATAGNIANLRVNGSSSTTNIQLTGSVASQPNVGFVEINTDSSQVIEYKVANSSDALTLYGAGFTDFI